MHDPRHIYKCNGFEPLHSVSAQEAALEFAQARAREIFGPNGRVEHINLEDFSPDGRIQRYTANLCGEGERRRVWLCVNRVARIAEDFDDDATNGQVRGAIFK
jgi:hypothetical protein